MRAYVKKNGKLGEEEMLELMRPIIDAVEFLHKHRMTHLDIKPDNIMLATGEDSRVRPTLIDFGLSKHYGKDGKPTSTINTLGCSDGYAPIEQYGGITTFSPSADVYALGATMLFCLTGKDPKKATEFRGVEKASLLDSLSLSEDVCNMLKNALQSDASLRKLSMLDNDDSQSRTKRIKKEKKRHSFNWGKVLSKRWFVFFLMLVLGAVIIGTRPWRMMESEGGSEKKPHQEETASPSVEQNGKHESPSNEVAYSIPEDFILVPGGTLKNMKEWNTKAQEYAYYDVPIDSFYICKYELTQKAYSDVMGTLNKENYTYPYPEGYSSTKTRAVQGDSIPVNGTYLEFVKYCNARSESEGYAGFYEIDGDNVTFKYDGNGYRLLSEFEWVYAARSGNANDEYRFIGSDDIKEVAWYGANSGGKPHPVGEKKANGLGLYDMSGNMEELLETKMDGVYREQAGGSYLHWLGYGDYLFGPYHFWGMIDDNDRAGTRIALVLPGMKNSNMNLSDKY